MGHREIIHSTGGMEHHVPNHVPKRPLRVNNPCVQKQPERLVEGVMQGDGLRSGVGP